VGAREALLDGAIEGDAGETVLQAQPLKAGTLQANLEDDLLWMPSNFLRHRAVPLEIRRMAC
jgi:hypothetical protein